MPDTTIPIFELSETLDRQIRDQGVAAYPNECCGIIFGRDVTTDGVTRRVVESLEPVPNEFEAGEQYHRFLITPAALMKAEKACTGGLMVLGFYHSHPDHPARPSEYDREHGWPFYSYVIVAIAQRMPTLMTCWVLDEQTEQFKEQRISVTQVT
jgi:proteasome lid subunit RPN8/RPN11